MEPGNPSSEQEQRVGGSLQSSFRRSQIQRICCQVDNSQDQYMVDKSLPNILKQLSLKLETLTPYHIHQESRSENEMFLYIFCWTRKGSFAFKKANFKTMLLIWIHFQQIILNTCIMFSPWISLALIFQRSNLNTNNGKGI